MNTCIPLKKAIVRKNISGLRLVLWLVLITNNVIAQETVLIDGKGSGRIFDGICGVNAGGGVGRLLINYPEPQRSEILDFLFKPNYGASFQGYKAEIGGDGNSTEGSEPSHMHTAGDENYNLGYQWWMMKEEKKRNPNIKLHVLAWDFPGWLKEVNSQATADYLVDYVRGAKKIHHLNIDYIGLWNETKKNNELIKRLRKTLDANGFTKVQLVADDQVRNWGIADSVLADKELYNDVNVVTTHYPKYESGNAKNADKPIWNSEDGPWNEAWGGSGQQSGSLAKLLNLNYIRGRMTSTHFWCLLSAYDDILDIPNAGVLRGQWPWTGHYEIKSPLWVIEHTTQFAQPGWQYIDTACGELKSGGSFAVYMAFPFAVHSPRAFYDLLSALVEVGVDQMPNNCGLYNTVQNGVNYKGSNISQALTTLDAPMGIFDSIVRSKKRTVFKPETGHFYSILCDNYWTTNFAVLQPSKLVFRHIIECGTVGENIMPLENNEMWGYPSV